MSFFSNFCNKLKIKDPFARGNFFLFVFVVVVIVFILYFTRERIVNYPYDSIENFKTMISVIDEPTIIIGKGKNGAFFEGRKVTLSPYKIGKYEVSFAFWKEVYNWAVNESGKEYIFHANAQPGIYMTPSSDPEQLYVVKDLEKKAKKLNVNYEKVKCGLYPATKMSWSDAIVWCNALSEKEGLEPVYYYNGQVIRNAMDTSKSENPEVRMKNSGYRLPTEAEWEFAARGGNTKVPDWDFGFAGTVDSTDIDLYAWHLRNSSFLDVGSVGDIIDIHPIGQKKPNRLGLYDMSGNCWEWCFDRYNARAPGDFINPINNIGARVRIIKSGSAKNPPAFARVKSWGYAMPIFPGYILGFRLAQSDVSQ